MRKLVIVLLFLAALLLAPLLALRSENTLISVAYWAVDTFTDLRLELKAPVLKPFKGIVSAKEIHLFPKDNSGPPFVSILGFSSDLDVRDFYAADLSRSSLAATQLIIYVSDNDNTSDPAPLEWLQYLTWFPKSLDLEQVHLITASKSTFIFPLKGLIGRRTEGGNINVQALAQYDGEPLEFELKVSAVRDQVKFTGLDMTGRFKAPVSGSEVRLDGELRGTVEDFNYDFKLIANYTDISEFMSGFRSYNRLAGVLQVQAKMQGDTGGFKLTDARFLLNNLPNYGIEAVGSMTYDIDAGSTIRLVSAVEMSSMAELLDWIEIDLQPLGRTQGSAVITGTLQNPIIDEFILHSESEAGLSVNVKGHLEAAPETRDTNRIAVDIHGPELAVLSPWTGTLPYATGQFSASGILTGAREIIALDRLLIELGSDETAKVRVEGSVENLVGIERSGLAAIRGVDLKLNFSSPDSTYVGDILELPLPSGFEIDGTVAVSGTGAFLQPTGGKINLVSSDVVVSISPTSGAVRLGTEQPLRGLLANVDLALSDTSAISQFTAVSIPALGPVTARAVLAQTPERLALNNIELAIGGEGLNFRSTGSIGNLQTLDETVLDNQFFGVEPESLVHYVFDDFDYSRSLGVLGGNFRLSHKSGSWNLEGLSLESTASDTPLYLKTQGSIYDLSRQPKLELHAHHKLRDPDLLEALTGLRMNPIEGDTRLRSDSGTLRIENNMHIGSTLLETKANVLHQGTDVTGLTLQLNSPRLALADVGLQAATKGTGSYNPSQVISEVQPETQLQKILKRSPRYPTDVALKLDGIVGEHTNIDSLDLHVTGLENRYTVRRFSVGYDNTVAELRGLIDLNPQPPFVTIAGEALAIPLNTIGRDLGKENDIKGRVTIQGGLAAQGYTKEELLKDVDGSLAIALENAEIEGAAYDVLATDLLAWFYSGAAMEESTHIDCTMGKFALLDGVAKSDSIYIETKKMVATGSAELDMVREKMDIKITPRSKTRQFQVPSSVRLKGDFDDPKATISPVAAAFDAYAEFITLLPRMVIKMFGGKSGKKRKKRPCEAVN